jgi:hypothetical protein
MLVRCFEDLHQVLLKQSAWKTEGRNIELCSASLGNKLQALSEKTGTPEATPLLSFFEGKSPVARTECGARLLDFFVVFNHCATKKAWNLGKTLSVPGLSIEKLFFSD